MTEKIDVDLVGFDDNEEEEEVKTSI